MCELLGMSANVPTDICFSFTGLMQRGGKTGPHRDGWGIAFYEGRGCRTFHDPNPSAESEIARLVQRYAIKSPIVVSHIRRANRGRICSGEHPSLQPRTVGAELGVRPQRATARRQTLAARPLPADRHHRQRARFLLAAGPHPRAASRPAAPAKRAVALHPRADAGVEPARRLQFFDERFRLPVRPLRHATVVADPPGAVRPSLG
jgi:hypothetical protein